MSKEIYVYVKKNSRIEAHMYVERDTHICLILLSKVQKYVETDKRICLKSPIISLFCKRAL